MTMRLWLAVLVALTLARLVLAASLPLSPDEAYYYLWSRHLQAGYFDHPPMVAYFIWAGTRLFGPTALGVRCMAPLAAAMGSVLLWDAGERMFPHRQAGVIAAALLNATVMVGAGAIIITPDTPLLLFWTAGLAALARVVGGGDRRWWLAVGLAAGLALMSKYTALLFIVAVFIWLVTDAGGRAALRGPLPWVAVCIAALVFAPDVVWNAAHGWVSYLKQGGRVTHFDAQRAGQFFGEFVFGQIALASPIIFALAAVGLWRLRAAPSPAGHLLVWLTIVPGVVFVEHVLSGRVQANWAAIMYPSACLAAAALPMAMLRRWLTPALALGFGLNVLVSAQALSFVLPVPARVDPLALQLAGWPRLARAASAGASEFVTSDDYATSAILAFYAPPGVVVVGFGPRWSYLGAPDAELAGVTGVLLTRRPDTPCPDVLGRIMRRQGTAGVMAYRLCGYTADVPGVVLPRP